MAAVAFNGLISETYTGGSSYQTLTPTETYDTDSWHDAGTNPTRMTVPVSGWYLLRGVAYMGAHSVRYVRFRVDGGTSYPAQDQGYNSSASRTGAEAMRVLYLYAGQYVEFQLAGASGGNVTTTGCVNIMRLPSPLFAGGATSGGSGSVIDLTETVDAGGWHSDSTNPSRVTVGTTGNYLYMGFAKDGAGTNSTVAKIKVNGSDVHQSENCKRSSAGQCGAPMVGVLSLTSGDYIELWADQAVTDAQLAVAYIGGTKCAMATQASGTSIPVGGTTILFDSETVDTDGFHSTSSNTGRLTMPTSESYAVFSSSLQAGFLSMGQRLKVNGTLKSDNWKNTTHSIGATGNKTSSVGLSWIDDFTAGDYLTIEGDHDSGSAKTTQIAGTFFAAVCLDDFSYESSITPQIYRRY